MESEEYSESDSYSDGSDISDTDINPLILPNIEAEESVIADDLEVEGDSDLHNRAFEVLAGQLSMTKFDEVIKQKSLGVQTMSPAIACLLGEANMNFVRGKYQQTLRLCKEAICLDPWVGETYRTMSEMYEELGDHEKALQLGMLAAALCSRNAEDWVNLGDKAIDLEKHQDALYCYTKATKINPTLSQVHLAMIRLYDPENDRKSIIVSYQKLVKHSPEEKGAEILQYAKSGAQLLHQEADLEGALELMELSFQRVAQFVQFDDVNLISELYILQKKYVETLQVISRYCDVCIEAEEQLVADNSTSEVTSASFKVINCVVNGAIPLQIRAKLIIALIHLKAFHLVDVLLPPLVEATEEFGDLLIDIVEVFMAENKPADALPLLKTLVKSTNFSLPQVWLHYAECLKKLGRKEEAVSAYLVVMEQAPQLSDPRLVVSELLNDLGRSDEAISALTQDPNSGYLDVGMLFERCQLLRGNSDRALEFLAAGRLLLSRHCTRFRDRKDYALFLRYSRTSRELSKRAAEVDYEERVYVVGKKMPTPAEEYDLFKQICQTAFENKQYALLQRLTSSAITSKVICHTPEKHLEIYAMAALSSFYNQDTFAGHTFFKNLVSNGFDNNRLWNVFNFILTRSDDLRPQKYIVRALSRNPMHTALPKIFANYCYCSGTYKQALSEYLLQFKHDQTPLAALLIAATCLQLSMQKHAKGINALVTQAMGFINQYKELRGKECLQEIHYNFGRMNHQLNLLPAALYHYKQVLEIPAPYELYDLKREAAFNLARIYQASNAHELARYYTEKYIVV